MKTFFDKNGAEIKAGDTLRRDFFARWRERPGHKRVAINGMSHEETIVPDEGRLLGAEKHWVKYSVVWSGACLVADRINYSDFQVLMQAEKFDSDGNGICEGAGFHYFNGVFDSTVYEICDTPNREESDG